MVGGDYVVGRDIDFQYAEPALDGSASADAKKKAKKRAKKKKGGESPPPAKQTTPVAKTSTVKELAPQSGSTAQQKKLEAVIQHLHSRMQALQPTMSGSPPAVRARKTKLPPAQLPLKRDLRRTNEVLGPDIAADKRKPLKRTIPVSSTTTSRSAKANASTANSPSHPPHAHQHSYIHHDGMANSHSHGKRTPTNLACREAAIAAIAAGDGQTDDYESFEDFDLPAVDGLNAVLLGSNPEQLEPIQHFWESLDSETRKELTRPDKTSLLECLHHERRECSCAACAAKRDAVDEELDLLYASNKEWLEEYAATLASENSIFHHGACYPDIRDHLDKMYHEEYESLHLEPSHYTDIAEQAVRSAQVPHSRGEQYHELISAKPLADSSTVASSPGSATSTTTFDTMEIIKAANIPDNFQQVYQTMRVLASNELLDIQNDTEHGRLNHEQMSQKLMQAFHKTFPLQGTTTSSTANTSSIASMNLTSMDPSNMSPAVFSGVLDAFSNMASLQRGDNSSLEALNDLAADLMNNNGHKMLDIFDQAALSADSVGAPAALAPGGAPIDLNIKPFNAGVEPGFERPMLRPPRAFRLVVDVVFKCLQLDTPHSDNMLPAMRNPAFIIVNVKRFLENKAFIVSVDETGRFVTGAYDELEDVDEEERALVEDKTVGEDLEQQLTFSQEKRRWFTGIQFLMKGDPTQTYPAAEAALMQLKDYMQDPAPIDNLYGNLSVYDRERNASENITNVPLTVSREIYVKFLNTLAHIELYVREPLQDILDFYRESRLPSPGPEFDIIRMSEADRKNLMKDMGMTASKFNTFFDAIDRNVSHVWHFPGADPAATYSLDGQEKYEGDEEDEYFEDEEEVDFELEPHAITKEGNYLFKPTFDFTVTVPGPGGPPHSSLLKFPLRRCMELNSIDAVEFEGIFEEGKGYDDYEGTEDPINKNLEKIVKRVQASSSYEDSPYFDELIHRNNLRRISEMVDDDDNDLHRVGSGTSGNELENFECSDNNAVSVERNEIRRLMQGSWNIHFLYTRLFEQRVLKAYREKVARDRQISLLQELAEEEAKAKDQQLRKQKDKDKKKSRKLAARQQREEEAQKKAEEAKRKAEATREKEEKRRQQQLEMDRAKQEAHRRKIEERISQMALKSAKEKEAEPSKLEEKMPEEKKLEETRLKEKKLEEKKLEEKRSEEKQRFEKLKQEKLKLEQKKKEDTKVKKEKTKLEKKEDKRPTKPAEAPLTGNPAIKSGAARGSLPTQPAESPSPSFINPAAASFVPSMMRTPSPNQSPYFSQTPGRESPRFTHPPLMGQLGGSHLGSAALGMHQELHTSAPLGMAPGSTPNLLHHQFGSNSSLPSMASGIGGITPPGMVLGSVFGSQDRSNLMANRGVGNLRIMRSQQHLNQPQIPQAQQQPQQQQLLLLQQTAVPSYPGVPSMWCPVSATPPLGGPSKQSTWGSTWSEPKWSPAEPHAGNASPSLGSISLAGSHQSSLQGTPRGSVSGASPMVGTSPMVGGSPMVSGTPMTNSIGGPIASPLPGSSPWAARRNSSWGNTAGPAADPVALDEISTAAKACYPQVRHLSVDGFVPTLVLYHSTLERTPGQFSQHELFKACEKVPEFQCLRDDMGFITHIKL